MIQLESDIYFSEHGALQEGEVVVLGAHQLKCKHVFHAVGPTWHGGQQGEPMLLGTWVGGF
jgi:O-acetyl-ADP-ribose deacetylase (regulator of RNase III)